jgi:hypothetical protein
MGRRKTPKTFAKALVSLAEACRDYDHAKHSKTGPVSDYDTIIVRTRNVSTDNDLPSDGAGKEGQVA